MTAVDDLIVGRRFCGPPDSGNGGWTAGALATRLGANRPDDRSDSWPLIEVTLRQPPPLDERLSVLGRMTARLDTLPVIGEEHVVVGENRGSQGRKTFTAATLYDADRRVVGAAEHIWITVEPTPFGAVPHQETT